MDETIEQLRADRDRFERLLREAAAKRDEFERFWLSASDERDRLAEKLTEQAERFERSEDRAAAAWDNATFWQELCETLEAELEAERRERDALIRLEVDRLTGRTPARRGRPPTWSAESEAEVERRHRAGASVRAIAAELHASKTQVHRVIARVRRQQAEAAARARLVAIADGQGPEQRAARVMKQAAERWPIEAYDLVRAERYRDRLRNMPDDD